MMAADAPKNQKEYADENQKDAEDTEDNFGQRAVPGDRPVIQLWAILRRTLVIQHAAGFRLSAGQILSLAVTAKMVSSRQRQHDDGDDDDQNRKNQEDDSRQPHGSP